MNISEYIPDYMDPKIILEYLSTAETLTLSEFSRLTHFFLKQADKDDLTIDEKCLMSTYLAFIDIMMPEGKNHSCTGKRKTLQQYYFNNYKGCSNETNQEIANLYKAYYEKRIAEENERDEKIMESYHPEIYNEMIELRKQKENKKVKIRKHG